METPPAQRQKWLDQGWLEPQREYWERKLRGLPDFEPAVHFEEYRFPSTIVDSLARLTAFVRVLYREERRTDICVGLADGVAIRVDASSRDLADSVRSAVLEAWENRDFPPSRMFPAMFLPESADGSLADITWTAKGFTYNPERYSRDVVVGIAEHLSPHRHVANRADAIANSLRQAGAGYNATIAVMLDRSEDLPASVLAVWQVGATYLPLDPSYPAERLAFMIEDAGAVLLVTQRSLAGRISAARTILIDEIEQGAAFPPVPNEPDRLAYVIYTSGSSGQPKGVEITHRGLDNFLRAMLAETGIGVDDVFVAVTTISFDIAFMELLLPIWSGARLVIVDRETASDGRLLRRRLEECGATILFGTPATWRLLIEAGWSGNPGLKILCGGEAMTRRLADDLLARAGTVWNLYGPTETTICSTIARVTVGSDPVPIGYPIANTQIAVVDDELLIGGGGVARGYRNRPDLTSEKFTAFGAFRTGDRVRERADGALEYLGRLDNQAKVRGNRIELEEIEAALEKHPRVRVAAAAASGDVLTAYITGDANPEELSTALAKALPAFMVPSRFVRLETMPLTPNGKIDRQALPAAYGGRDEQRFEPPQSAVEKFVASVFAEVLHLDHVSREDDFFHLGGHSLVAGQVLSRVWEMWKIELPLRALFEAPTVAALAQRIEGLQTPQRIAAAAPRTANAPLSFAQERLLFLDRLYGESRALYNIPILIRLSGSFDRAAFTRALNEVIRRHETLRTNFVDSGVIVAERRIEVPLVTREQAHAERYRPFDLERDSLIRACVVELGPAEWEVLVVMHHIIADGWSVGVLFREINTLYAGGTLAPLLFQYADFAVRERSVAAPLDYWRKQLAGSAELLDLPADRARPAHQSFAGGRLEFHFPEALSSAARDFSRRERATVFMTLLAAFEAVLHRYTGETDLCIGTPVANRNRVELEGLIGFFVNTLVLRSTVAGEMTFRQLAASVRETALDAYAHQDAAFQQVVEAVRPERGTSHTPLFQVLFVQSANEETLRLPGLVTQSTRIETELVKFDITVNVEITEPAIRGVIEYNRDLFELDRMERLAAHYQVLLAGALENPELRLQELPLLTEAERRTFAQWNNTKAEYAQQTFPELFAEQVAKTPDRIAAECAGRCWTYSELKAKAGAVAGYLIEKGWRTHVGIECERSLEMLAGLIGIWRAGAAYVPIDPEFPEDRRAFLRSDSGVSGVLTKVLIEEAIARGAPPPLVPQIPLESTAYVLYTSGSTGRPKGVVVPHRSLTNFLFAVAKEIPLSASDVVLAIATIAFDIATLELYLPLLAGARVVIAPDRRDFLDLLTRPTVLQATPATWRMLIEEGWSGNPRMRLISTGEALPRDLAKQLLERGASLLNLYGPTETNYSSAAWVGREEGPVPIGRPLANTRFQVVDGHGNDMPIGIAGELCISGDNVTLGYLNQPALSAERFRAGVYRTGDLVRYRADGQLEYLRRMDNQVKLRGYRIEPGEVEAAIVRFPGIRAALVLVREELLVAYLAAERVDVKRLRRALAAALPEYMVPARFVRLDAFPLTANGKVDRRALPDPEAEAGIMLRDRSPVEEVIANIFASVLGLAAVKNEDNFFRLGGHSLLAMRAVSRLRETLGTEIALKTIFEEPTVAGLARRIERSVQDGGSPIERYARTGAEPLSFAQQRLWFLDRLYEGELPLYNMPYAFLLRGPLDTVRLHAACERLICRHEMLRTVFVEVEGTPHQAIHAAEPFALEMRDVEEGELHAVIERAANRPFDLALGPLWRVEIYRLTPQLHALLVNMHHIVSDGWSFDVLYQELRELYAGGVLPELPIQYADFARWQRAWFTGERLEREVAYWKGQLAGAPPLLDLPRDRPRPSAQTFAAGNDSFLLDRALTEKLHRFSRDEGVTLFMTLLAGWQLLLARYTGTTDISVGTPIANRTRVETERLIGFFTNTLVLRTRWEDNPSFRVLVRRVRDAALGAYAHQDLPFEKLVEVLEPERNPGYTPLFQVMFLLQNQVRDGLKLEGLEVEPLPARLPAARFDVLLSLEERGDCLEGLLNYNRDLFDATRMERMAADFELLLDNAMAEPDVPARVDTLVRPRGDGSESGGAEPARSGQTPVEALIAGIFASVLGVPEVDSEENFFHLGGHSLLATRVVARIRDQLGVKLPLRTLFEVPTAAGLARHVVRLRGGGSHRAIQARTPGREVPMPFSQQRLWFLDRYLEGQTPMYNIPSAVMLTGPLDISRLRGAFQSMVERHETLRTTFSAVQGVPVATIGAAAEWDFRVEAEARIAEESERPFDLARGPLLRVVVYRLALDRHVLLVVMHHIISDGWSVGVMYRELRDAYEGKSGGPLGIQYSDYAQWLAGEAGGDREIAYWRRQLAGTPPLLELPVDRVRPAEQTYRGGNHEFGFDAEETEALKRYCRRGGATPFMTMLAALQIVLARYSGSEDISVGTAVANRTQAETEDLIGLFVNTLVMRTNLGGEPTFQELVYRVREVALGAYEHQSLPFEKLVETLQPERSTSYSPLFQVLFLWQNAAPGGFRLAGLTSEPVAIPTSTARFDLSLAATELDGRMECILNYNRDLFEADRMRRMAGHLRSILLAGMAEPRRCVWKLPLLTGAEVEQMTAWNRTSAPVPDRTYPELFREQARRTPDAMAVECEGRQITYSELDGCANAVAVYLRERGAGPETLVGIVVERSIEMMAGLLGIWKAGGAYVPIDPEYPSERQAFLRKDSGVAVVLTRSVVAELGSSCEEVASGLGRTNLAYVIYTSGSTGKPKGVEIEHGSLVNHLEGMRSATGMGPGDTMLALATAAFDMSVPELWLPLMVGGCVVLATRDEARDGRRLREKLEHSGANIMQGTPFTWSMLLDEGWRPAPPFRLLCGAEAMPRLLAERLAGLGCTVWNLFGPTETTVWSTMGRVCGAAVSIGEPMANTVVHVFDKRRQRVPIGVPGELYIGGAGVARGYLGQADLTAQKFVAGPSGERLFRTGDRVRWRADGELEFVDRLDDQVKLRGYRVELGEIEAALERCAGGPAAVALREDELGDKQLVAYLASDGVNEAELRTGLAAELPGYMMPSQFVVLDRLPLSVNGKLDRAALPAPGLACAARRERTEPCDALERQLVEIWESVLGQDSVSAVASFFALGGHSLQAARLAANIEEATGKRLPLSILFALPSVRQIASYLRGAPAMESVPRGLAAIQPRGSQRPVFLVEARSMFWQLAKRLGPDQPLFGMHWPDLSGHSARPTVEDIAKELVKAVRARQPRGPYVLGGWCLATLVAYEMAQQLSAEGEAVDLLLLFDGANLAAGQDLPAWRKVQRIAQFYAAATGFHWRQMRTMPSRERVAYGAGRASTLLRHLRLTLRRYQYKLRVRSGLSAAAPSTLRDVERVQAVLDYRPKPYGGRTVYFKRGVLPESGYFEGDFGWGRLLEGGLDVYETTGRHGEMFTPPHVDAMAATVRRLLADVRAGQDAAS